MTVTQQIKSANLTKEAGFHKVMLENCLKLPKLLHEDLADSRKDEIHMGKAPSGTSLGESCENT